MEMIAHIPHAADDLVRAALTGLFDPRALIPEGAANETERLSAMADLAIESELDGRWLWTLTPDSRRAGLARLPDDPAEREAVLAVAPRLDGDRLGAALRASLEAFPGAALNALLNRDRTRRPQHPKLGGLDPNALAQALELLEGAKVRLPDWAADPATARALRRAVVLDRRARAAHRLLPTPFRGRGRELKVLEGYIRDGIAVDHASRPVMKKPSDEPEPGSVNVMIVTGIGGTGKSALIEALRRRAERTDAVTFLGFDLDQTSLRSGERVALTIELLRQIGLLHPELDQPLSALRGMLRDRLSSITDDGALLEAASSAIYSALSDLAGHLQAASLQDHGFALVFDTFEQAMVTGEERLHLIADWLMLLRNAAGIEKLRVILSGREADMIAGLDIPGLVVAGQIELGDLGTNSGRAKLRDMFRRFGIDHLDLVPDLISAFGSNPLVIEIVAAFCRDRPRDEIIALVQNDDDGLRGELDTEMRQRILYTRILNRITDPKLRPLASPGLILRRITPELIEKVLAEPCGLPQPLPLGRADTLYEGLSGQVWLVRPSPSGDALEHVPDLRRLMLPQILALPEAVDVAQAAADWYEGAAAGASGPDLWESFYYRALTNPDALHDLAPIELLAIADHLGAAAIDLPLKARAMLREASGALLSRDEISALSGAARSRAALKRQAQQLSEGLEQTVLDEAMFEQMEDAAPDLSALDEPVSREAIMDYAEHHDLPLLNASFAAADFDRVAESASRLAASLWQNAASLAPADGRDHDLTHPAWLAGIATLAPGLPSSHRENLFGAAEEWAHNVGRKGGAKALLDILNDGGGDRRALARLALLVMALAAAPNGPLWPLEQALEGDVPLPAVTGIINTTLDWRYKTVLALRCDPALLQPDRYTVPASELPMLHPDLICLALDNRLDFPAPLKGMPGIGDVPLDRFADGSPMKLSEVTRTLNLLDRVRLHVDLIDLPADIRAVVVPGRLTEFHAPLRLLLDNTDPGPILIQAVAEITAHLPWWPKELAPDRFAGKTLGPTLIGSLIDLLDRAGMLPELAGALVSSDGFGSRAARISGLIGTFSSFMRGDNV